MRSKEEVERTARALLLPAADEYVSHLHMQAVADLLDEWESEPLDEWLTYTREEAARDLRLAIASACTCRSRPHDRQCPRRVSQK